MAALLGAGIFAVVCLVPVFLIPLVVGSMIVRRSSPQSLASFAGWLTLKPVWATPLWLLIYSQIDMNRAGTPQEHQNIILAYGSALPGVLSTIVLLWLHRAGFRRQNLGLLLLLLLLDIFRWGNTLWMTLLQIARWSIPGWHYGVALLMPGCMAAAALVINTLIEPESAVPVTEQ